MIIDLRVNIIGDDTIGYVKVQRKGTLCKVVGRITTQKNRIPEFRKLASS
jgi:hypothetical protein